MDTISDGVPSVFLIYKDLKVDLKKALTTLRARLPVTPPVSLTELEGFNSPARYSCLNKYLNLSIVHNVGHT